MSASQFKNSHDYFEAVGWAIYRKMTQSGFIETNLSTLSAYWPDLTSLFVRMCGWLGDEWTLPKHPKSPAEEYLRACAAIVETSPMGRENRARHLMDIFDETRRALVQLEGYRVRINGESWDSKNVAFVDAWNAAKKSAGKVKLNVRASNSNTVYDPAFDPDISNHPVLRELYTTPLWALTLRSALACGDISDLEGRLSE